MYLTYHFKERLRLFLSLFLPILIYQLANYSASFVDTAMTGQYRTLDLAGVSTATSLWNPFFTFLTGIVSALTPIVGHHLGKGNKERVVYLNEACRAAIEVYLPYRIRPNASAGNALFVSRLGNRMSVQTVKELVHKYLDQAGLGQKHCSVHKLRHTAATLMYQNGVDVRTLKEVLGHENLDTTMIYTHVVDQNLRDAAEANPLGHLTPPKPREESPKE